MIILPLTLLSFGFFLAYANGGNDVSKGIATLVGSGVTRYRHAILWGTAWTAVGAVLAAVLATAMFATFGRGFLAPGATPTITAGLSTICGAATWVLFATRTGLPVSTTHAIVGALTGVAVFENGLAGVRWSVLGAKIFLPLLVTPLLSLVAVVAILRLWERRSAAQEKGSDQGMGTCLCADTMMLPMAGSADAAPAAALMVPRLRVVLADTADASCAVSSTQAFRVTLDHLHWLTSGATSFARGLNDAPKIAALVLGVSVLAGTDLFLPKIHVVFIIALGMVAGSLVAGLRVTRVLAERVTPMNHREGFVANLVAASLVTTGATLGLPMSTTHVASGGIVGAGAQRGSLNYRTLRDVLLAWIVTLPASALIGVGAYWLADWVF